jgi:hypothetical protein
MSALPPTSISGFGICFVVSPKRFPFPAASNIALMVFSPDYILYFKNK